MQISLNILHLTPFKTEILKWGRGEEGQEKTGKILRKMAANDQKVTKIKNPCRFSFFL